MSTTTYLSSRNLPCRYWLNASSSNSFAINATSFRWNSIYGSPVIAFNTTDFNNLPTRTDNKVSIPLGAELTSMTTVNNLGSSCTLIHLSNNLTVQPAENLIDLGDADLAYAGNTVQIDYSRLGFTDNNIHITPYLLDKRPLLAMSHDLKGKKIELYQTEETTVSSTLLAYEKGIKLQNSLHKLQGPNLDISHVLFFSPAISTSDVIAIIDSLVEETPGLASNLVWDNITSSAWNSVTTALWEGIK